MGDGDETIRMLKEYGLEETISEVFSGTMDKKAVTTTEVEIDIKKVANKLKEQKFSDKEVIEYLEELEDDNEREISVEFMQSKPFGSYIYITFQDGEQVIL